MNNSNSPANSEAKLADNSRQREISAELKESVQDLISTIPKDEHFLPGVLDVVGDSPAARDYVLQIASIPRLKSGELDKLLKERKDENSGPRAIKRLNEAYMRIPVWIAKDYQSEDLSFLDLINDGILGLLQAVKTYEGKDFTFEEYICCVVKESIALSVLAETESKQVPQYLLDKINSIKEVTKRLTEAKGSEPTHEEIAQDMGFSLEELNRLINLAKMPANADS